MKNTRTGRPDPVEPVEGDREKLEYMVRKGVEDVQRLHLHAAWVRESSSRVRQLIRDLERMATATELAQEIEHLTRRIRIAAEALGQPVPYIAAPAKDLPTKYEMRDILDALTGRPGFVVDLPMRVDYMDGVEEIAEGIRRRR